MLHYKRGEQTVNNRRSYAVELVKSLKMGVFGERSPPNTPFFGVSFTKLRMSKIVYNACVLCIFVPQGGEFGPVINPDSAGKQRTQMVKATALAGRELIHKTSLDDEFKDLSAFMILALQAIFDTIDPSVLAWEKRGYWVKADQFRMEWSWTQKLSQEMHKFWLADDWPSVVQTAVKVLQKLGDV